METQMSDRQADLAGAIKALSSAIATMARRQDDLAAEAKRAKKHRREQLDQRVLSLLPDLSAASMQRLQRAVPMFATNRKVVATFAENRKVLWLFKPDGYDDALMFLQAQLKHHLEREGEVGEEDQILQRLEAEQGTLSRQQAEAMDFARLMETALRNNTALSPEAVRNVNRLAQRAADPILQGTNRSRSTPSRLVGQRASQASAAQGDDDWDLWLWMMTDIPSSFRTLMLDSITHHHHQEGNRPASPTMSEGEGRFSGAGASVDFGKMEDSVLEAVGVSPAASAAIATDDSLGRFS